MPPPVPPALAAPPALEEPPVLVAKVPPAPIPPPALLLPPPLADDTPPDASPPSSPTRSPPHAAKGKRVKPASWAGPHSAPLRSPPRLRFWLCGACSGLPPWRKSFIGLECRNRTRRSVVLRDLPRRPSQFPNAPTPSLLHIENKIERCRECSPNLGEAAGQGHLRELLLAGLCSEHVVATF
jgi:hypothetical protein